MGPSLKNENGGLPPAAGNARTFSCPHCGELLAHAPGLAGQVVACPFCKQTFGMVADQSPKSAPMSFCRNCGNQVHPQAVACLTCGLPPRAGQRYCPHCRGGTLPQAVICVKCGGSLQGSSGGAFGSMGKRIHPKNPPTEPVVACLLSILLVGVGQMVLGQSNKGVVMLLGAFILGVATLGAVWIVTVPLAALDAYLIGNKLKNGKSVGEWECF